MIDFIFNFPCKPNDDKTFWSNLVSQEYYHNKMMIMNGYDINTIYNGKTHFTKIVLLSSNPYVMNMIDFLLANNADINKQDENGNTPLMVASRYTGTKSSLEIVDYLLRHNADPNICNNLGESPLIISSLYSGSTSSVSTVIKLLAANSKLDAQDSKGWTALMYASIYVPYYSDIKTVHILVTAGINPFIENNQKNTVIRQLKDTNSTKITNKKLKVMHHTEPLMIEISNILQNEMERRIKIKTMSLIRHNSEKKYNQMPYLINTKPSDNTIFKVTACPLCNELMTDPVKISSGVTYCSDCIEEFMNTGGQYCPMTGQILGTSESNTYMNEIITGIRKYNTPMTSVDL